MTTIVVSAANERYGWYLLNLLGSLAANSPIFDRAVVFDLGLSRRQRRLLSHVRRVDVREVPPFAAHWADGFTWKPWIWTHVDADAVVYLDAGITVLRSLEGVVGDIRRRGYFVVSQGRSLAEIVPSDYYALYNLSRSAGERDYVAAGILGFTTRGRFYDDVIVPTYEDCLRGLNLGVSPAEAGIQFSLEQRAELPLRDCERFRHDQTILNIHLAKRMADAEIGDLDRFGGWQSPRDHPLQVIWNHRRRGDFHYLARVAYRLPAALVGRPLGLAFTARWWLRMHRWLFRPTTYTAKLCQLTGRSRARR